jgi:uncharacterized protein (TIGR02246 family)
MKRRIMITMASIAWMCPAYAADNSMAVLHEVSTKWQTAFNAGDTAKLAALYAPDALFASGILGMLNGKPEIEAALSKMLQQKPQITFTLKEARQNGDVMWGVWEYTLANGPTGYGGVTLAKTSNEWQITLHVSNVTPKKP